jgi:hypothetical protein
MEKNPRSVNGLKFIEKNKDEIASLNEMDFNTKQIIQEYAKYFQCQMMNLLIAR